MARVRPEDAEVKIPALIHLTRLGYGYLPRGGITRDPETNILSPVFRSSLQRINGVSLSDEAFGALLSGLRDALARDDLGRSFFEGLRNSWGGLRLLDFERPENNTFHIMTELPYSSGNHRFRPDISLFVNGLPLAFVEVKSRHPRDGVRSEYDRMLRRSRDASLRRFINETQIMVFSNDAEYDENDLIPTRGAFYATSAYDDLVFNRFEEEEKDLFAHLPPVDPDAAALIRQDNGLGELPAPSLSPDSPTHRLLTSLFHARRLLFFLRYGISYLEERREDGTALTAKQIVRYPQLFAVLYLEHQLQQGSPGGIWHISAGERCALASVQIRYMQDWYDKRGIPVHFFCFVEEPGRALLLRGAFLSHGFRVIFLPSEGDFLRSGLWEEPASFPPSPLITVVDLQGGLPFPLPPPCPENASALRVCFFDSPDGGYALEPSLPALLRSSDPGAVLIEYSRLP